MKIDVVKAVKLLGLGLTIGGMVVNGWVGKKENNEALQKAVEDYHKNKAGGS